MIWKPRQPVQAATAEDPDRNAMVLTVLAVIVVLTAWWLNQGSVEVSAAEPTKLPSSPAR